MNIRFFFSLFAFLLFVITGYSQIPNAGFENWDSNGNPVDWWTSNTPPIYTNVFKTSDAHSGSWAVEGDVVSVSGFTVGPTIISGVEAEGIPINFRPAAMRGYYKFTSVNNDYMQVQANFKKNGIGMGVGAANLTAAGSYTQFDINIIFISEEVPDTVIIAIFIFGAGGFPNVGSKMFVDDLSWSNTSDVRDLGNGIPNEFELMQNYPNPFNPSTKIRYSLPEVSFATIEVYDMLGNEVLTLINEEQSAGSYEIDFDGSGLSSGMYFYTLQTNKFTETKKMLLLK